MIARPTYLRLLFPMSFNHRVLEITSMKVSQLRCFLEVTGCRDGYIDLMAVPQTTATPKSPEPGQERSNAVPML